MLDRVGSSCAVGETGLTADSPSEIAQNEQGEGEG